MKSRDYINFTRNVRETVIEEFNKLDISVEPVWNKWATYKTCDSSHCSYFCHPDDSEKDYFEDFKYPYGEI